MEHSRSRPKRLCASRQYAKPSAVHYVGYVEDEETPEMIMKKFEELERVSALSGHSYRLSYIRLRDSCVLSGTAHHNTSEILIETTSDKEMIAFAQLFDLGCWGVVT